MNIARIQKLILKITLLKVFICTFIVVILFFYLKTFFTMGVYFHDAFLKKQVVSSQIHYTGTTKYGKIQIIVKGLVNKDSIIEVDYILPNDINKNYKVEFGNVFNSEIDMDDIEDIYVRDSRVGIENIKDEDGNVIFPGGVYKKDFSFLFQKNGEPFMDVSPVMIDMENAYNNNYKLPLNNVVAFATSSNDVIRGKYEYFIPAVLLLIITLINIKFPLFFFILRNGLDVKDPELSDFYIIMQSASRYVYPIIAIILMIAALQ